MVIETALSFFLGDVPDVGCQDCNSNCTTGEKTGCVGTSAPARMQSDTGLPDVGIATANRSSAKTMIIGVVMPAVFLPDHLLDSLSSARDCVWMFATAGCILRLEDIPAIAEAAKAQWAELHNVRQSGQKVSKQVSAPKARRVAL